MKKEICGRSFVGFGAHLDDYPVPYLTAACAIGIQQSGLNTIFHK